MTTITTYTDSKGHGYENVAVEVRFTKRSYGGWIVRVASTGRELGWLVKDNGKWEARVSASAFRGQDETDTGDVLDDVPGYLYNGSGLTASAVAIDDNREDAASSLVWFLHRNRATALGYGPHPAVRPWRQS